MWLCRQSQEQSVTALSCSNRSHCCEGIPGVLKTEHQKRDVKVRIMVRVVLNRCCFTVIPEVGKRCLGDVLLADPRDDKLRIEQSKGAYSESHSPGSLSIPHSNDGGKMRKAGRFGYEAMLARERHAHHWHYWRTNQDNSHFIHIWWPTSTYLLSVLGQRFTSQ